MFLFPQVWEQSSGEIPPEIERSLKIKCFFVEVTNYNSHGRLKAEVGAEARPPGRGTPGPGNTDDNKGLLL